jgi:FkbM family methyltransferase
MAVETTNLYMHKTGAWLRRDTHDKYVIRQINQYRSLNIIPGCRVLDIGGHIGLFARYAIDCGALHVLSIEPHPGNCDVFELNVKNYPDVELIEAAVVPRSCNESEINFYESTTDTSAHSIVPIRGRNVFTVDTIKFEKVLCEEVNSKSVVIKIDIEGGEFGLFQEIIELFPLYKVWSFAIEFHFGKPGSRELTREFIRKLDLLYTATRIANVTDKAWNATGVWNGT